MTREIKFRAWDKKNNKLVKLSLLGLHTEFETNPCVYNAWENEDSVAHYSDVELMQFTGLKDKNGKEIYEGDIVNGYSKSTVEYLEDFAGFFPMCNWPSNKEWEVIGNIHENPELLK